MNHKQSFSRWAKFHTLSVLNNLAYPVVKPLDTEINTCFIVGCGHAGTTMLAEKLGNNTECLLINRETNVFLPTAGIRVSKAVVREWLYFARYFEKTCLVEKTPKHIHVVNRIRKVLPKSKIVILIRNPLDNCASLYRRFDDLEFAIERWRIDNRQVSELGQNSSCVYTIKYEELTAHPLTSLKSISEFVGLSWNPDAILATNSTFNKGVGLRDVEFGQLRSEQISRRIHSNNGKWCNVFSDAQAKTVFARTWILARELGYDLGFYESYGLATNRFRSICGDLRHGF